MSRRRGATPQKQRPKSTHPSYIPPAAGASSPPCTNMASQTEGGDPETLEQTNFAAIMQAINDCKSTLTGKIDGLQIELGLIRKDADKIRARVAESERRVGEVEDVVHEHSAALRTLQTKVKFLEGRAEDAENRNRRNNLRIVGLPEGTEGTEPTLFAEKLFRTLFPQAQFSAQYVVERAHRLPAQRGPPGGPPRTFILKLLNFRDRDLVLREARKVDMLKHEAARIMIFPDYSAETQRQRKAFDHVKMDLRNRRIKYSMLFPSRLRVQDGETVRFFSSPEDAANWLESLPGP